MQLLVILFTLLSVSLASDRSVSIAVASSDNIEETAVLTCGIRVQNVKAIYLPPFDEAIYTQFETLHLDACVLDQLLNCSENLAGSSICVHKNQTCFYTEQAYNLQSAGANMVIFLVDKFLNIVFDQSIAQVEIEGIQILYSSYELIKNYDRIKIFDSTKIPRIDPNVIFLLLTALLCIFLGMWWGLHLFVISIRLQTQQNFQILPKNENNTKETTEQPKILPATTRLTIIGVLIMFAIVCGMILLAYFYPVVISYFIYVSYVCGALSALIISLASIIELLPQKYRTFFNRKLYKSHNKFIPTVKMNFICTFPIAVAIIIIFFVLRFTGDYYWIVQNLIGIAICVVFIANVRLHRFHIIVVIFCLFIVYDVFFVFITPYLSVFDKIPETTTTTTQASTTPDITITTGIPTTTTTFPSTTTVSTTTKKPPSVMEYVALGLGTNGQLPIVFMYPFLIQHRDPCQLLSGVTILGLGDVLVPGVLGMYCAMFDFLKNNKRIPIYSIAFCISYIAGLSATFIALNFMDIAQPALLYIIPITLFTILLLSLVKKDIGDLFKGRSLKLALENCDKSKK